MNIYLKKFLHRGLVFAGFGPIVLAIIYFIISRFDTDFALSGKEVFVGIISIYLLAFIHAGASVFNQIDHWPVMKSLLYHFLMLYAAYSVCYIVNSWIPFDINVLLIFTAIFIAVYFLVWAIVLICIKATSKKMNSKIK